MQGFAALTTLHAHTPGRPFRAGARSHRGADASPGDPNMARTGWTTISIPDELYDAAARHVPKHSRSVQAFVAHYTRIGVLVEDARNADGRIDELVARIVAAIEAGK